MNFTPVEWQDEIENALEYRRIFAFEESWNKLEGNYLNDPNSDTVVGPNLVFSEGDTLLSGLILPYPYFVVEPDDPLSTQTAPIVEALQNSLAKPHKLDLKKHVEQANLHNFLYSKAILKIGYDSQFGWNPRWDIGTLQGPMGLSRSQYDKKGKRIEFSSARPGMPWVAPVIAHDFVVPWGTGDDIESAPWVAHRIVRETSLIKKDAKFKNTTRLTPQISMEDYIRSYTRGPKKSRDQHQRLSRHKANGRAVFNEMWEIHSKDDMKVRVICFEHDKFLRDEMDFLQLAIGGYPFVTGSFVAHPRCFWSTPQAYYLGQHQKDQYDLSLQIQKQRRINVAKFLMMGDVITPDEMTKIISGDVGAVVRTKPGKKIQDAFMAFPKSSNFDLIAETETVRRNARDAIGHSRNQAGEFDASSRRTASEAAFVREGSQTRLIRREDVVKHLYLETMRKVTMLVFKFWPNERDILVGTNWQKFVGAKLRGQYNYTVDLVSNPPLTPVQRKIEALQMTAFFLQFPNANMQAVQQFIIDSIADPRFEGFFGAQGAPSALGGQMSPASGASAQGSSGRAAIGPGAGFGGGASR